MKPAASTYKAYQLFGFDFMVDAFTRVHLIEVNATPASAQVLLHEMARDVIRLTFDACFPPPQGAEAAIRTERRRCTRTFRMIYSEKLGVGTDFKDVKLPQSTLDGFPGGTIQ